MIQLIMLLVALAVLDVKIRLVRGMQGGIQRKQVISKTLQLRHKIGRSEYVTLAYAQRVEESMLLDLLLQFACLGAQFLPIDVGVSFVNHGQLFCPFHFQFCYACRNLSHKFYRQGIDHAVECCLPDNLVQTHVHTRIEVVEQYR